MINSLCSKGEGRRRIVHEITDTFRWLLGPEGKTGWALAEHLQVPAV
jgi:hypothetical protein